MEPQVNKRGRKKKKLDGKKKKSNAGMGLELTTICLEVSTLTHYTTVAVVFNCIVCG